MVKESFRLIPDSHAIAPILIPAEQSLHGEMLDAPVDASYKGDEPDQHLVLVLIPGQTAWMARGTYSGIRTRGELEWETGTGVYLEDVASFVAPEGKRVILASGAYLVEQVDDDLELTSEKEGQVYVLKAQPFSHNFTLKEPVAMALG